MKPKHMKSKSFKTRQLTQSISMILLASTAAQSTEFFVFDNRDQGGGIPILLPSGVFVIDTLRSAVEQANNETAFPGADTIRFVNGLFHQQSNEINLNQIGDSISSGNNTTYSALGINSQITIIGPQEATLSLIAGDLRHFQINAGGELNISHVTLEGGFAPIGFFGRGGAINVRPGGRLQMSDSILSNNQAGFGGAVYVANTHKGEPLPSTITRTSFINNKTYGANGLGGSGGAVLNDSELPLRISHSTFSENSSRDGGALFNTGSLIVESSTISNNTASRDGGGIGTNNVSSLSLINSSITNNQAKSSGGGVFIGTASGRGINTIINSSITGNQSSYDSPPQLNNSTINRGYYLDFDTTGGGVFVTASDEVLIVHNSIIAGNTETTAMLPDDMAAFPLPESSHNLIGGGDSIFVIADGVNGNQIGTRDVPIIAEIGPLANNGGLTLTQLPNANSPVIDAGNAVFCAATDQRGNIRPQDGDGNGSVLCDIGAVEIGDVTDLIFKDSFDDPTTLF